MHNMSLRTIGLRVILFIFLLSLDDVVFCLNPTDDNVCLAVRLDHLSNCEAFILYSNHCAAFFDSQLCQFVQSESRGTDTWKHDVSIVYSTLYNCCPGFTGADCSEACTENMFGPGCHGVCQCQNGSKCSPVDGSCTCPDGWTGHFCERTCTEGWYGAGCMQQCPECGENSYCDNVNGQCICGPNSDGELCTEECIGSEIGGACLSFCDFCPKDCGYDTCCDHIGGYCICGPGRKGRYCTELCDIGTFGYKCKNVCQCENDAVCLSVNGSCLCMPGWKGTLCSEPCEQGFYGNQCLGRCNCPNNSSCDHVTGVCLCSGDWQGPRCNEVSHCKPADNCQPANGTCIADEEELFSKSTPPIKVAIAAGAGATTFLFLVVFAIYCMKRTRVQSRTFSMETKLPLFSNGPQPPPRPAVTTFNNEPVYDSIGEDGHYLEIIEYKPSGIYNPEYIISGGEGYMIPSKIPGLTNQDTSESSYSTDSS